MTAPCSALMPMPPTPTITTVSPGCTWATLVADPKPVGTAQPMMAAVSNGMSLSILTTESLCTVMYGANVPSRFIGDTSVVPACTRTGAVGDGLAAEEHRAAVTQRPVALETRRAFTAGGDEGEDDVVALLDAGDVAADLGDDARALVAAERGQADGGGSGGQVIVRVAHARGVHTDLHLVVDGVADLDLVDPER